MLRKYSDFVNEEVGWDEEGWDEEDDDDDLIDKLLDTIGLEGYMLKYEDVFFNMIREELIKLDNECINKIYDAVKKAMNNEPFEKEECVDIYTDAAKKAFEYCYNKEREENPPTGLNVR